MFLLLSSSCRQQIIDKYFQHSTVESILAALEEGAAAEGSEDGPWCTETLATLRKMSPTSLKVSPRKSTVQSWIFSVDPVSEALR